MISRRVYGYVFFLMGTMLFLAACGSPKSKAQDWADRFPTTIGLWEQTKRTELSYETQTNYGYITLEYQGQADRNSSTTIEGYKAYITIMVYANESAADVGLQEEILDWEVQGVRFESEQGMDVAILPTGYVAYLQEDATVVGVRIFPETITEPETALVALLQETPSRLGVEVNIALLLDTVREVAQHVDN